MAIPGNFKSGGGLPGLPPLPGKPNPAQENQPENEEFIQMTEEEVEYAEQQDEYESQGLDNYVEETEVRREPTLEEIEEFERKKGYNPRYEDPFPEDVDDTFEEEYIDKKKRRMVPMGGKKSKKKQNVKAKDFDKRKNALTTVRLLRFFMMIVILGIFGMGVKNTFFPSHVYSSDDIQGLALEAVGKTGFPMERGAAFAEQFAQAYFNFDSEDDNTRKVLNTFYGGSTKADSQPGAYTSIGKTKQNVLVTPSVFSQTGYNKNIAFYSVATLVSDKDGKKYAEDGTLTAKWVAINITVYYDDETDQLTVAPDSPALIPSYGVAKDLKLPQGEKVGTGISNDDLYEGMAPTINGFLKAYGMASPSSHADLDQYVKTDPDPSIYQGFGGAFAVREEDLTSSKATVYPATDGENNNEWKVDLDLMWHDTSANTNDNDSAYRGRYIMTLEKSKDGKYFVSSFKPYIYTPQASE